MSRRVVGLQFAAPAPASPWPVPRARGVKALGLRFERKVAKALAPAALHSQWLRFRDNNGPGYCSPDVLLACGETLWVLECKLSDWAAADAQIEHLYKPILQTLWPGPVRGMVVLKHLNPLIPQDRRVETLDEALAHAAPILWVFSGEELTPRKAEIRRPALQEACNLKALSIPLVKI